MNFDHMVGAGQDAVYRLDPDAFVKAFEVDERDKANLKVAFYEGPMDYSVKVDLREAGVISLSFGRPSTGWERNVTVYRLAQVWPLIKATCNKGQPSEVLHFSMHDGGWANQVTFCSSDPQAILIPDCDFVYTRGWLTTREAFKTLPDWSERSDVPFWRGSNTGFLESNMSAQDLPRARLCALGDEAGFDTYISHVVQGFDEMKGSRLLRAPVPWQEHSLRRFNIDIDGNSASWNGLFMKLLAGGVVLKVTSPQGFRQWYYDKLLPWKNYVPVKSDLSDLLEVIDVLREDPCLAQEIAQSGRELAEQLSYEGEIFEASRQLARR